MCDDWSLWIFTWKTLKETHAHKAPSPSIYTKIIISTIALIARNILNLNLVIYIIVSWSLLWSLFSLLSYSPPPVLPAPSSHLVFLVLPNQPIWTLGRILSLDNAVFSPCLSRESWLLQYRDVGHKLWCTYVNIYIYTVYVYIYVCVYIYICLCVCVCKS